MLFNDRLSTSQEQNAPDHHAVKRLMPVHLQKACQWVGGCVSQKGGKTIEVGGVLPRPVFGSGPLASGLSRNHGSKTLTR